MRGIKSIFAALVLTAMVNVVPLQAAVSVKVMIAGSSAMWQTMALGAYAAGKCVTGGTAPCHHYTAKGFNLTDIRPTLLSPPGSSVIDTGSIWIVWDSASTTHVWAYIKVDSVVGTRCYFAQPQCNANVSPFPAPGSLISSSLWGDGSSDTTPPSSVSGLFTASGGLKINVAATDIRPEDGLFAQCRANAVLGGGPDGLQGLGWGTNANTGNPSTGGAVCPLFGAPASELIGTDIVSGLPGSTSTAHPVAFNITGSDPFTGTTIPTPTTVSVGAAPIVFITSRSGALATVTDGTDSALKSVFSGGDCNASAFGAPSGAIEAYLREPLSGTMNTTEYTVFRYPNEDGTSQETGVGASKLSGTPCAGGGGARTRVIGTSEAVSGVSKSITNFGIDGIAYAFFSYGNVSSIASSSSFGYLTLNGVDGIFASYSGGDPGEPGGGTIPGVLNLPSPACGTPAAFPCPESAIWTGGLSFPNLRSGKYRAWSVLRLVSNGAALTNAKTLVSKSNSFVVTSVPDYVPFTKPLGTTDPGLTQQRSHYGPGAVNTGTGEKGRDAGGCIQKKGSTITQKVQDASLTVCSTFITPP